MPAWTGPPSIKGMFGGHAQVDDHITRLLTLHLEHFRCQRRAVFPSAFQEAQLREVDIAVLLLIGDHEIIYSPELTLEKSTTVLPNVEAELVSNCGHLINMERPTFTDERLLSFLLQQHYTAN